MKLFFTMLFLSLSFSAFAAKPSPSQVIQDIEEVRRVRCQFIKNSFAFCLGSRSGMGVCRYSKTYACDGEEMFKVILKVREFYNQVTQSRQEQVLKVEYQ